jgi:ABC-type oligopeptide transport system substrate-binding subunit
LWREALGIQVESEILDWASYVSRLERDLPHLYLAGWLGHYPDPNTFLRVALFRLTSRWRNETYEDLVERAGRGSDQAERMELYGQADRMLIEEAIALPLGQNPRYLLIKPWVSRYPLLAWRGAPWKDVIIDQH